MEDAPNFYQMEDNLNFFQMEDDLNFLSRQPRETIFGIKLYFKPTMTKI